MTEGNGRASSEPAGTVTPSDARRAVLSGVIIPSDMRVRLVRAESAALDAVVSLLFTAVMTVFGALLGAALGNDEDASGEEITGIVALGVLGAVLLGWWLANKWKSMGSGVSVPGSVIQEYGDDAGGTAK